MYSTAIDIFILSSVTFFFADTRLVKEFNVSMPIEAPCKNLFNLDFEFEKDFNHWTERPQGEGWGAVLTEHDMGEEGI